jgi:hypothetical protein
VTDRRRRPSALLAATVAAFVVSLVAVSPPVPVVKVNDERAPGLALFPTGWMYHGVATGTLEIVNLVDLRPLHELTILDAAPLHVDPGLELLAVRAAFLAHCDRCLSDGGHRQVSGTVLSACIPPTPITGHGPSYPVRDLRVIPAEYFSLLFYFRSVRPGAHRLTGYRIRYRVGRHTYVVTGDRLFAQSEAHDPGTPDISTHGPCLTDVDHVDTEPEAGFPP